MAFGRPPHIAQYLALFELTPVYYRFSGILHGSTPDRRFLNGWNLAFPVRLRTYGGDAEN